MGFDARDLLYNCQTVLRGIVWDEKADPILRVDAARHLADVEIEMRRHQLDPDARP